MATGDDERKPLEFPNRPVFPTDPAHFYDGDMATAELPGPVCVALTLLAVAMVVGVLLTAGGG